jgi:hypothetical protein
MLKPRTMQPLLVMVCIGHDGDLCWQRTQERPCHLIGELPILPPDIRVYFQFGSFEASAILTELDKYDQHPHDDIFDTTCSYKNSSSCYLLLLPYNLQGSTYTYKL